MNEWQNEIKRKMNNRAAGKKYWEGIVHVTFD